MIKVLLAFCILDCMATGLFMTLAPRRFLVLMMPMLEVGALRKLAILIAAMGVFFVWAAPQFTVPIVFVFFGGIYLFKSLVMAVAPGNDLKKILSFFFRCPAWVHRLWGFVVIAAAIVMAVSF